MRLFLVALCFALPQIVFADAEVAINKIYAPLGYTDRENTQVVITGVLPTSCYHLGNTDVEIERTGFFKITQHIIRGAEHFCANIAVSYQKVVPIGKLPRGDYHVYSSNPVTVATILTVTKAATTIVDEYAPVFHATISGNTLHLSGFAKPCLRIDRVETDYQTARNIIAIEPITKKCTGLQNEIEVPFSADETVTPPTTWPVLIHVRTGENRFLDVVQDSDLTALE